MEMDRRGERWKASPKYWAKVKQLAREKRRAATPAENALWQHLRTRQLIGAKFRRQHCIEPFIVDFYCRDANLVIEVDGPIHSRTREEDAIRQEYLEQAGLTVIRFTNEEVLQSLESVLERIRIALRSSPSLRRGEGAGG